ncbi:MAG: CCA tRNA nucleotidyltransferase, partial [Acidimicrobiales bacterium]
MIPERVRPLVAKTAGLAERFEAAGRRLYLVGGVVRDAIVSDASSAQAPGYDLDLTTDARPDETEGLLDGWADAIWLQGKRFGTIAAIRHGTTFEITTHRAEVYDPDSRKPEVVYADAVEADLYRRDFTINAMA